MAAVAELADALTDSGDFDKLFASLDTDGSGELDRDEFTEAVRSSLKIDTATLSDEELVVLFDAVHAAGSGEIDSGDFAARAERGGLRGVVLAREAAARRAAAETAERRRGRMLMEAEAARLQAEREEEGDAVE